MSETATLFLLENNYFNYDKTKFDTNIQEIFELSKYSSKNILYKIPLNMTIKLVNTLTNRAYYLENLQENANSTDMFYCFDIQLPEGMVDGEYEYFLYDDGYELVKGLCIIGDFEPNSDTYHNNNSETIVYNG